MIPTNSTEISAQLADMAQWADKLSNQDVGLLSEEQNYCIKTIQRYTARLLKLMPSLEAEKAADATIFVEAIGHIRAEWRQPIMLIRSCAELLQTDDENPFSQDQHQAVRQILALAEKGANWSLINNNMTQIDQIRPEDYPRVVEVWEASVRATHHFVKAEDIEIFRPIVRDVLPNIPHLLGVRDEAGKVAGFIGVADRSVEMLFIHLTGEVRVWDAG